MRGGRLIVFARAPLNGVGFSSPLLHRREGCEGDGGQALPRAEAEHCVCGGGERLHCCIGKNGCAHQRKNGGDEGEVEEGASVFGLV